MTHTGPGRVVITGASGGIGRFIARRFTGAGARVVNIDIADGRVAEELCGPGLTTVKADLADPEAVNAAFATADGVFDGAAPDCLVCCAALSVGGHFLDLDVSHLDRLHAVNVRGTFLACQQAARRMKSARAGRIVVITSVAADQAWAGEMLYCVTKAAQRALVQTIAVELAPFGIQVNAVGPGIIEADSKGMVRSRDHEAVRRHDLERTPLDRFGQPQEVAEAVWFLAHSTWMTGQTVYVDGGFLASGLAYFGAARHRLSGDTN
jgi:3-oxoacyl-[acyl-carrier protein] reductase